ncbi:MAG: riboflavin synthase [Phycisphaerales bacterium]|nr:riboflavin synthase [Phycisphaerales bacterium]
MFTGLIHHIGQIRAVEPTGNGGLALRISVAALDPAPQEGDSIAIEGCCLTVSGPPKIRDECCELAFEAVPQTLQHTMLGDLAPDDQVHVELALRVGDPLGGHMVQGHVDDCGRVEAIECNGDDHRLTVQVSSALAELLVPQGSICLAGVSLTIAAVHEDRFTVALIPTTLDKTRLDRVQAGDRLNIEMDMMVRTVAQIVRSMRKDSDAVH